MNHYIKKIVPHLEQDSCDSALLRETLYRIYRELHPRESEVVRDAFSRLDMVLKELPLKEYDKVWDLTCEICGASEEQAFLEGLRVGIWLCLGEDA